MLLIVFFRTRALQAACTNADIRASAGMRRRRGSSGYENIGSGSLECRSRALGVLVQREGKPGCGANDSRVWASLLLVVPVGLVLGLLAFGDHGGSRLRPTPASLTAVGVAALAAGPVAVELMGAFFWLLGVALVVACFTIVVVLRVPRHPVPE